MRKHLERAYRSATSEPPFFKSNDYYCGSQISTTVVVILVLHERTREGTGACSTKTLIFVFHIMQYTLE